MGEPKLTLADLRTKLASLKEEQLTTRREADVAAMEIGEFKGDIQKLEKDLETAAKDLQTLKSSDMNALHSMNNPPFAIKLMAEAMCVMLQISPDITILSTGERLLDYWEPARRTFLNALNHYHRLCHVKKDGVPSQVMSQLRIKYLSHASLQERSIMLSTSYAVGLRTFFFGVERYDQVSQAIKSKKDVLAATEKKYETLTAANKSHEESISTMQAEVEKMVAASKSKTSKGSKKGSKKKGKEKEKEKGKGKGKSGKSKGKKKK